MTGCLALHAIKHSLAASLFILSVLVVACGEERSPEHTAPARPPGAASRAGLLYAVASSNIPAGIPKNWDALFQTGALAVRVVLV